jgi:Tfp pilus assembly protein PilO
MRRNRTIFLLGLLFAAILLAVYSMLIYPRQQREEARLKREAKDLEEAVQTAQEQLSRVQNGLGVLLSQGTPVHLRAEKPWGARVPELIGGIDGWVRKTRVVLLKLEPEAPEERAPVVLHPFLLEITGGFPEICAFLQGVEQDLKLILVQWTMEADSKTEGIARAFCRFVAYEWIGELLQPSGEKGREAPPVVSGSPRDPFVRSKEPLPVADVRERAPAMSLTGILHFGAKRKAIIDGNPHSVGDSVGGRRILAIGEDEVVLEGDGRPLKIDRPLKVVAPSARTSPGRPAGN